jgi:hypothetical protein
MKNFILLLILIQITSCCKKKTSEESSFFPAQDSYSNACCCNTLFDAGIGKVFVPSMFTPNSDGKNENFRIYANPNIKYVVNVHLSNNSNTINIMLDTVWGGTINKNWNGKMTNGNVYNGSFKCDYTVIDNNNTSVNLTANSASYTLSKKASEYIPNHLNCKFEDQLNPFTFLVEFVTSESNFN